MKQSGLLLVVCWISMWEDLSFLQEFYQQNRQPETIRLAVALIMCAVLLPVFGCPLGGSGGYRDGKSVQFVAGQPVGEAVFDQAVAGEAGFTFKIGRHDGGKKVMAVAFHLNHFGVDDFANHGLDLFGSEHVGFLLIS